MLKEDCYYFNLKETCGCKGKPKETFRYCERLNKSLERKKSLCEECPYYHKKA